jgi:hypothetical protein
METNLDHWQLALQEKKTQLEACQKEHHLKSCFDCEHLLSCEIRESYVAAVYESMSKGTGGGFEF